MLWGRACVEMRFRSVFFIFIIIIIIIIVIIIVIIIYIIIINIIIFIIYGTVLSWLSSYLSERTQTVSVNGSNCPWIWYSPAICPRAYSLCSVHSPSFFHNPTPSSFTSQFFCRQSVLQVCPPFSTPGNHHSITSLHFRCPGMDAQQQIATERRQDINDPHHL